MEFDKNKVYTALNADELKIGSKVILEDDLASLKLSVEKDRGITKLVNIKNEDYEYRFIGGSTYYHLAYLVEEPEEKILQWTDLKIGDVLRNKRETTTAMVTQIDECVCDLHICAGMSWIPDGELENWEKVE